MVEVLLVRREIFVVRRIEIHLSFVKIQREVVSDTGGIGPFSKRNCQKNDFHYHTLATALRRGRYSSKMKPPKLPDR